MHYSPREKKMILLLAGIVVPAVFFLLPRNSNWLNRQVIRYYKEFPMQIDSLDEQQRMESRFGAYFTYTKQIATSIQGKAGGRDMILLIPPTGYFKDRGVTYRVPEPAVFYYFTGVKTVWPDNSGAADANWYVRAEQGRIIVEPVTDKARFMDTLALFRKYRSTL